MQAVAERPRLISIGALSEALGVSPSAIRKWERRGLIEPAQRIDGGRRVYLEREVEGLRLVAEARRRQRTAKTSGRVAVAG